MADDFDLTSAIAGENKRIKSEARATKSAEYSEAFGVFWEAYPRKTSKGPAYKAWVKRKIDDKPDLQAVIAEDLRRRESTGWFASRTKAKIPHPSTYLNQARWEDEDIESEIDQDEVRKRQQQQPPRPQPKMVEQSEPSDVFRNKTSILFMELVKFFIGTRGVTITEDQARRCWNIALVSIEPYRSTWSEDEDQSQSTWEALMSDMLNKIWREWMVELKLTNHKIASIEEFRTAIVAAQSSLVRSPGRAESRDKYQEADKVRKKENGEAMA